jgi:RNA polymerase sigma-70 factor (ECF subfamily)
MRALINRLKSDEALMLAYQRGDSAAFECLYHRHKNGLYAFLYNSCPSMAVVEELAQDAWMGVVNSAASYRAQAQFRTWLYQIARNRMADFWRRRDNTHQPLEQVPEPLADAGADSRLALQQRLMTAIAQLPAAQREALLLQEQGFSLRDIAQITAEGEETIKSRLRYARRQLRQLLGDET